MKTSILISSITALCFLVTVAVVPRRHGEDKMNLASTDNISIVTVKRVTMLPGVVITANRNEEAGIAVPVIPVEDFTYLNFNVNEYSEADLLNLDEAEVLPEVIETEYSYLKFKISDYITDSELIGDEITELPVNKNNTTNITTPEPTIDQYEYLRLDVTGYITNSWTEAAEIGELPLKEAKTGNQAEIIVPGETTIEFGYLKFDVTKYYRSDNLIYDEQFELPEE